MDPVLGCWHNDTLDSFKVSLTSHWTNLPSNLCWWKDNQESAWQLRRSLLSIFMMLTTNQSGKLIHSSPSHPSPAQQHQQHCTEARQERGENQTDQYRGEGCLLMSQTLINMITCLPQEATKNSHFITKIHNDWLSLQWSTCNHSKLSVNRISITCYRPTTQSFCNGKWQHPENLQRKSKRTAT